MTEAPVLKLPYFSKQSVIQTEASGYGMRLVINQNGQPISFLAKKFAQNFYILQLTYVNYMYLSTWKSIYH